jgi:hypothetical protein
LQLSHKLSLSLAILPSQKAQILVLLEKLQQDTKATMKCLNLIIMLLAYDEILALPMERVHAFLLYVTRTHTISPFSTIF